MQFKNMAALRAVANVLAHPFRDRALVTPKPVEIILPPTPRALLGATVRADVSGDPKAMIAALQGAFQEFRDTNDAAVGKKADSAEINSKLEAINGTMNALETALNDHALKIAAAQMGGTGTRVWPRR